MVPPLERLTKRPQFLAAAKGRRFHTERMTVQGLRRDGAFGLRVGYTVTKRVGHATERNRIRRRLRTAMAEAAALLAAEPADVVVVGRRDALDAPYGALVDDLARGLRAVIKPTPPRRTGTTYAPRSRSSAGPDLQA